MTRSSFCVIAALSACGVWALPAANFNHESAGAPSAEIPEAVQKLLEPAGVRVKADGGKVVAEYWARKADFSGDPVSGFGIRFDSIPEGALIAAVRFPEAWLDFREQSVHAGWYTIRYVLHPEDGNHMGVAPSRDFGVLTPLAGDAEPEKNYGFDALVEMTKKVGNAHPTVVRLQLPEGDEAPHLWEDDFGHQVLDLSVAGEVVGIVVEGHSEE